MPTRVLAEDQRGLGDADILGPHDLVRAAVLQHAVLMDTGFMSKRIAPDDRLVRLHGLARQ